MKHINNYIVEKLQINKDSNISEQEKIENHIDEILHKATSDKYDVSITNNESHLYIIVKFEKDQDNDDIHNWGLTIFNDIIDETKYKELNRGSDWWVSSPRKIVFNLAYK